MVLYKYSSFSLFAFYSAASIHYCDSECLVLRRLSAGLSEMCHCHSDAENPSLDVGELKNYWPVSDLTFMSKVVMRIV